MKGAETTTKAKPDKPAWPTPDTLVAEPTSEVAGAGAFPLGKLGAAGDGSTPKPGMRLADTRLRTTQRQQMARHVACVQGNRLLQSVVCDVSNASKQVHVARLQRQRLSARDIDTNVLNIRSSHGTLDRQSVRQIQNRLVSLGFLQQDRFESGAMDVATTQAIVQFQIIHQSDIDQVVEDSRNLRAIRPRHGFTRDANHGESTQSGGIQPNDATLQALANAWPRFFFGVLVQNEAEAFALIHSLVLSRGLPFDINRINVVGMRAYQGGGTHTNSRIRHRDNSYDDTIFILALDENNQPRIREFKGTTDPGGRQGSRSEIDQRTELLGSDQQVPYRFQTRNTSKLGRPTLSPLTGEGHEPQVIDPRRSSILSGGQQTIHESPRGRIAHHAAALAQGADQAPYQNHLYTRLRTERGNGELIGNAYGIAIHSGGHGETVAAFSTGCTVIHGDWYGNFIQTLRRALNWQIVRQGVPTPARPEDLPIEGYVLYSILDGREVENAVSDHFRNSRSRPPSAIQRASETHVRLSSKSKIVFDSLQSSAVPNQTTTIQLQQSPLSSQMTQQWQEGRGKAAFFNRLRRLNPPTYDQGLRTFVETTLQGDDKWLAQSILEHGPEPLWPHQLLVRRAQIANDPNHHWAPERGSIEATLGMSSGLSAQGTQPEIPPSPIKCYFIQGRSSERALIIGGVHGSEQSGIEVVERLKASLESATTSPYFTTILVPVLFPDNRAYEQWYRASHSLSRTNSPTIGGGRYTRIRPGDGSEKLVEPNRNYPLPGQSLQTAQQMGLRIPGNSELPLQGEYVISTLLPETSYLIALIERFQPSRIASVHAHRRSRKKGDAPGIYVDPRGGFDQNSDQAHTSEGQSDDQLAQNMVAHANRLRSSRSYRGDDQNNPGGSVHYSASHPLGTSIGDWAPTAVDEGQRGVADRPGDRPAITTITVEVQDYYPSAEDSSGSMSQRIDVNKDALQKVFLEQH